MPKNELNNDYNKRHGMMDVKKVLKSSTVHKGLKEIKNSERERERERERESPPGKSPCIGHPVPNSEL
jgi:hypothetical protein